MSWPDSLAELELPSESGHVDLPAWVGQGLTEASRFKNANLIGVRWDDQDLVRTGNSATSRKVKP